MSSPLAHIVVTEDGRLAMANQRADALFGATSRDFGRPFQDLELSYRPVELRTYISEALQERRAVWGRGQSTNEELETMNEELQSMNDELQSSNDELRERTTEVGELNRFMESVFLSLRAAATVVDRDLEVMMWNQQAEDLWGLRSSEAIGQHLLNLDIGLPVQEVRPLVRRMIADGHENGSDELVLAAVNRRGRAISVRVRATPLRTEDVTGAILVIDELSGT